MLMKHVLQEEVVTSDGDTKIPVEVAWKRSKTFDIFSVLWHYGGVPLANVRWDMNGYRYQKGMIPKKNLVKVQKKLVDLEKSATVYVN